MSEPHLGLEDLVRRALEEDLGAGDVTSQACVPAELQGVAVIEARAPGVLAGVAAAAEVFRQVSPDLVCRWEAAEGDRFTPGQRLATVTGPVRELLTAERTALNFLQHLSGIATLTRAYVEAVAGTGATIVDTRKTTPGLRLLEKAAVRAGGGRNHRFGLADGVLIKDNHLAAAGGVTAAVQAARAGAHHLLKVEVEVADLAGLREALAGGAEVVLLDNMTVAEMAEAVRVTQGRALLEASGGVNLETVAAIAATGVDLISVGRLTHSAPSLDLSLELESVGQ
ncbi:MAG TPA: carboxylating nicotinate-nucleotide diphosphorylase [Armatimonadota bacterium]|jgi:nicotinate-nucleotide pyrophosphorylase (carboxylating)